LRPIAARIDSKRDKGFGYAKTSFEGYRTIRINNLLTHDDNFWCRCSRRCWRCRNASSTGTAAAFVLLADPRSGQLSQPLHEDFKLVRCRVRTHRSSSRICWPTSLRRMAAR
jgi:hypothetical protein